MTYRDDLAALAARHAALEEAADDAAKRRDEARALLDDARARARLPVLANLRVASPCRESWDAMAGDDRVRACGKCNQNVFNLSALTRDEAEALIRERAGRVCVRYYQRHDGTILLADCEIGRTGKRRRRVIAAGIAATMAAGAGALAVSHPTRGHVMGAVGEPATDDISATMGGVGPTNIMMGQARVVPGVAGDDPPEPPDPPAHVSMKLPR